MSENGSFERSLDVLISYIRVSNITTNVNVSLRSDEFWSKMSENVSKVHIPEREACVPSNYTQTFVKALIVVESLVGMIPVVGGTLSTCTGMLKEVVNYFSPEEPTIKEILIEELRDTELENQIDGAFGIIKFLHFCLKQLCVFSTGGQQDPSLVLQYIGQSVSSAICFLGGVEHNIHQNSQRNYMPVSDAKRLIRLVEMYCHLNLVVLMHFLAFKIYLPNHSQQFDVAFNSQKNVFSRTIHFLTEDNPMVSCYYPSKHITIKKSLKYFG